MGDKMHIQSAFDRDLERIQASIMKMGGLVEEAILDSAKSLETRDEELAEAVRLPHPLSSPTTAPPPPHGAANA